MPSRFLLLLLCGLSTPLACIACDSVRVQRENGNIVILHQCNTFDTRAAWDHFRTIASTNGPVNREVLVFGDDSVDVGGCARLIRAAGFKKVRFHHSATMPKSNIYE